MSCACNSLLFDNYWSNVSANHYILWTYNLSVYFFRSAPQSQLNYLLGFNWTWAFESSDFDLSSFQWKKQTFCFITMQAKRKMWCDRALVVVTLHTSLCSLFWPKFFITRIKSFVMKIASIILFGSIILILRNKRFCWRITGGSPRYLSLHPHHYKKVRGVVGDDAGCRGSAINAQMGDVIFQLVLNYRLSTRQSLIKLLWVLYKHTLRIYIRKAKLFVFSNFQHFKIRFLFSIF